LAVSLVLAQSGEFALVLFSLAFQSDLLNEVLFQQLLLVVLLSMLVTPILAHLAHRLIKTGHKTTDKRIEIPVEAPVLLAGFGRVGHRIGEILSLAGRPFVALDYDAAVVEKARVDGYPVYFGDVRKPEVLKSAGADRARLVIVTLNDPADTEEVVLSIRKAHPDIKIYARGYSLSQCRNLRRRGASGVVSENIQASLELARMALVDIGVGETKREAILGDFRRKYLTQIDEAVPAANAPPATSD
jgi:voltage-gated potassium channel Kch